VDKKFINQRVAFNMYDMSNSCVVLGVQLNQVQINAGNSANWKNDIANTVMEYTVNHWMK